MPDYAIVSAYSSNADRAVYIGSRSAGNHSVEKAREIAAEIIAAADAFEKKAAERAEREEKAKKRAALAAARRIATPGAVLRSVATGAVYVVESTESVWRVTEVPDASFPGAAWTDTLESLVNDDGVVFESVKVGSSQRPLIVSPDAASSDSLPF